jgi:hypothetical protein
MRKNWLIVAFVFLFAAVTVGSAQAETLAQGGTTSILVGNTNAAVSDIIIDEAFPGDLLSVEGVDVGDIPNGLYDLLPSPRPQPPLYTNAGCSGDRFRFTITLDQSTVRWVYNATGANTFPSLPFASVGMLPPTQTPPENFPNLFQILPIAQVVYGSIVSEFIYFGTQIFPLTVNSGSFCYEYGHPVAIRGDQDQTTRGFRSAYDVVVSRIAGGALVLDVIKPSVSATGGRIVIPGSVFRVSTTGVEAAQGESGVPLSVVIQSINTDVAAAIGDLGNPGVTEQTVQIATMVSRDNPGTGASAQVTTEGGIIRDVLVGVDDQKASNIRIAEQVDRQLETNENSQIEISLGSGVAFTSPPVVSFSGGLTAFLNTTTGYPTRTILVDVDQGPSDGAPGVIRISDIHINVNGTIGINKDIVASVVPTVGSNGVQSLKGLDGGDVIIARTVGGVIIGGGGSLIQESVSISAGSVIIDIDASPEVETVGELYVSVQAPTVAGLEDAVFFRPGDRQVPITVEQEDGTTINLYVIAVGTVNESGTVDFTTGAANRFYRQGTLSPNDPSLRFLIGDLNPTFLNQVISITTWYKASAQSLSQAQKIQTVEVLFTN